MGVTLMFQVIHFLTVFHQDIQEESRKYDAQRNIFDEIQGVWIAEETVSRVFDRSSQSKLKLRRKRRNKIVTIYANKAIQTSFTVMNNY